MLSKVNVWNMALACIGLPELNSPDDSTSAATECRKHYEASVDSVLRLHGWNCARKRVALSRLSAAPAFGWSYAYALPVDYVLLLETDPQISYAIESGQLLCNAESINILYVRKISNEAEFSPGFAQCVVLMLASRIAPRLTQENGAALLSQLHQTELPLARVADAYENRGGIEIKRDNWIGTGDNRWL